MAQVLAGEGKQDYDRSLLGSLGLTKRHLKVSHCVSMQARDAHLLKVWSLIRRRFRFVYLEANQRRWRFLVSTVTWSFTQ